MDETLIERVHRLLDDAPRQGLEAIKHLFWGELNYPLTNAPLSVRQRSPAAQQALAAEPVLLSRVGDRDIAFDIIYAPLSEAQRGRAFPLSIAAERAVIGALSEAHPRALYLFSDPAGHHWHLVNVRDAIRRQGEARPRGQVLRRIALGPHERLRTAAERVAMLDLERVPRALWGRDAAAVQRLHDEAFDVEAVTRQFFDHYCAVFMRLEAHLRRQSRDPRWAHDYALQFLNRLMFLYYVQRKGLLGGDRDFLETFWDAYCCAGQPADTFASHWLKVLFFEAFCNRFSAGRSDLRYLPAKIRDALQLAPYLNGGLFERGPLDTAYAADLPDDLISEVLTFLGRYNFTIAEDTPLDQEVAVDPEMLGHVYESLVNVSAEVDERGQAGIYYTPRVEIDLMCRLSLVDWLINHLGETRRDALTEFVFAFDAEDRAAADQRLVSLNLWPEVDRLLQSVTVCDPACGSGSFLVGMLHVLDDLQARAEYQLGRPQRPYDRKKRIVERSLYGVDVMEWAVHVAELRLWLQLLIETDVDPRELQVQPVLPNLSFKVRQGDSLVQRIGAIDLAQRSRAGIPAALKGRLTRLQGAKANYYYGRPDARLGTPEALRQEELSLFRAILDDRLDRLDARLRELAALLAPQKGLFGETRADGTPADRQRAEREQAELAEERERLTAAREALRRPQDVPFVWDIAFVEVFFGDEGGFDIVIGNPPYVRHEAIRNPSLPEAEAKTESRQYKEWLAEAVYARWPLTFGLNPRTGKAAWTLAKRSDLYIYFYLVCLSLLNPRGAFCFITSNAWLDVGYGADLQRFLLTRGRVRLIIDNQVRRSFKDADVNTVIALLGAPVDARGDRADSLAHTARFAMLTVPFEEALSPVIWEEIAAATTRVTTPEYRLHPVTQRDALAAGLDEKRHYAGDKWGGKYLRAPDIYWTILEKGRGKLVRLGDIADVRFGIKTGANAFFYLDEARIRQWGIEDEFLRPVIKSPREFYAIAPERPSAVRMFWCQQDRRVLAGTNALEYIRWGESQGYDRRESCRTRRLWYALSGPTSPVMLWPSTFFERYICYECPSGAVADKVFYTLSGEDISTTAKAYLNSSLTALMVEVEGYQLNHGGIFVTTEWLSGLPVLATAVPAIDDAYQRLRQRPVLLYGDEVRQEDRRSLDVALLTALGLPATIVDDLQTSVADYITKRIAKSRRGQTQKGRMEPLALDEED